MKVVRFSALRTGRLYPPENIPGTHTRAIVRPEGLCQRKILTIPSGFNSGTARKKVTETAEGSEHRLGRVVWSTWCIHWLYNSIFNFHLRYTKEIFGGRQQRAVLLLGCTPLIKWEQWVSYGDGTIWMLTDGCSPLHRPLMQHTFRFLYQNLHNLSAKTITTVSVSWKLLVSHLVLRQA
jgi:hypothetical protein